MRKEGPDGVLAGRCRSCGARVEDGTQRYCFSCGTRRMSLPAAIARRLEAMRRRPTAAAAGEQASAPASTTGHEPRADAEGSEAAGRADRFMPTPRAAAVAVMGVLAFGVILGSAIEPIAQSAGITPILLDVSQPIAPGDPARAASATPRSEPPPPPVAGSSSSLPAALPPEAAPPSTTMPNPSSPPEFPEAETLPPVTHVFLIVLADHGFEEAFGESSPAPYLATALRAKGELLSNYYAVTQGDLANEIALISGQGPTAATAANCPDYTDLVPGTVGAEEQVEGEGCVYPTETQTLPGQLAAVGKSWKAYVEDIGSGEAGGSSTCRHPAPGAPDETLAPRPGDAYEGWRNPVVYFHSLLDGGECAERDIGLEQLATDLAVEAQTPALSYIVPNACHDGSEQPCEEGQPSGLAAAQPFLESVVPEIEASPAYRQGGLIAITFAEAPQAGPGIDPSACCATPEYPNLPAIAPSNAAGGPVKPSGGGGRVGMLLLSPFVQPGSVEETGYYNHFSLLLSVEQLFGLKPLGYAAGPALSAFEGTVFNARS